MTQETRRSKHQRACLFAAGQWKGEQAADAFHDAYLIAIDGGAHYLQALGLLPHLIVGDLDSIDPLLMHQLRDRGIEFQTFPTDKDATDFELAMQIAVAKGYDQLEVYGALGGDLDHELGNLNVCARAAQHGVRIRLAGRNGKGCLISGGHSATLQGPAGSRFSVTPLGGPIYSLVIDGARWNGIFEVVPFGSTLSLRNELTGSTVHVSIAEGIVLLWQPDSAQ